MKPCVFIQTNHRQLLGALASQHSLRRCSHNPKRLTQHLRRDALELLGRAERSASWSRGLRGQPT